MRYMQHTLSLLAALLLAPLAALHAADTPAKESVGTFQSLHPEIETTLTKGWITLLDKEQPNVQHTALRRQYALPEQPGPVVGYVSAGTLYRLYVNGRLAMFGPAPATKGRRFVDEVDLTDFVRAGDNCVAIEWLYSPFLGRTSEFPEHEPGVGFCLTRDAKVIEPPDRPWRYRWFRAHDQAADFISDMRQDRSEFVDLSKVERGWAEPGFDDRKWEVVPPQQTSATPAFSRRPVPLPALALIPAAQLAESGRVYLDAPWVNKGDPNLSAAKFLRAGRFDPGGEASRPWNGSKAGEVLLSGFDGCSTYALFDLGQPVMGNMELDVTIPSGVRLDCFFIQDLDRFTGQPARTWMNIASPTFSHTLIGDGRRAKFAAFHNYSGRYLCLVARGLSPGQQVKVDGIGVRERSALPSGTQSAFMQCSDRDLNRLFAASLRTMRLCTIDFPIDGMPDEMKMYVEYCPRPGYPSYHVFYGQHSGFVRGLLDLMLEVKGDPTGKAAPDDPRFANAVWHVDHASTSIDAFFSFVHSLDDLRRYYGTPPSPRHLERAKQHVKFLDTFTTPEGLLRYPQGLIDNTRTAFLIPPPDSQKRERLHVSTNAVYYKTLGLLEQITGDPQYARRREAVKAGLNKLCLPFLRTGMGTRLNRLVPDVFLRSEKGWEPFSVPGTGIWGSEPVWRSEGENYRLLNSGILDTEDANLLWDVLAQWRPFQIPTKDDVRMFNINRAGLYMGLFERYDYLVKQKRGDLLLRDFRDVFTQGQFVNMIWTADDARELAGGGIGNSMYARFLFECLTGIKPGTQGGYAPCLIEPLLDDTVTWARGTKETQQGAIGVNWSRGENEFLLTVTLPKGVGAEVVLPSQATAIALKGGHAVVPGGKYTIEKPTTFRITPQQGVVLLK
jgi:hypothetical protein